MRFFLELRNISQKQGPVAYLAPGVLKRLVFSRGSHHEIALHLGNRYFTVTGQRLDSAPAKIETVDRAALEWLITDAGPRFKGDEPATTPKDDSRSGRAFRLAGECRRAGLDLDAFKAALSEDSDLAKWAKDARQVQRAWDRNAGEDLSAVLDECDDLPEPPEAGKTNPITALNRDHAAVMMGGKFRIVREVAGSFEVYSPEELHKLNANNRVKVPGEKRTEPVTSAWMRHPSRRTYQGGLVFNPKATPAGAYNIWRGWAVKPEPDAFCDLFLAHVRDVICDSGEREYRWLLGWMAHLVQRPEQKPGTAVVLRGTKGAGKDTFGDYLGALIGRRHHVKIAQPDHLTGRFNAHLENGLLLHLEEGFWAGDKAGGGVLKNLITCPTLQIERKGIDPYEIEHFARLLITSNEDWVVPATPGERRYCVLDVSPMGAFECGVTTAELESVNAALDSLVGTTFPNLPPSLIAEDGTGFPKAGLEAIVGGTKHPFQENWHVRIRFARSNGAREVTTTVLWDEWDAPETEATKARDMLNSKKHLGTLMLPASDLIRPFIAKN